MSEPDCRDVMKRAPFDARRDSLTLRDAVPADAETVHAFIQGLAAFVGEPDAVTNSTANVRMHMESARPPFECVLAELDGRAVGFAVCFPTYGTWSGRSGLWLEDLFVTEDARGRGIGEALLREAARRAVSRGCDRLDFSVLDRNETAAAFYLHRGARRLDDARTFRFDDEALARLGAP